VKDGPVVATGIDRGEAGRDNGTAGVPVPRRSLTVAEYAGGFGERSERTYVVVSQRTRRSISA
jgi:hypothetical protein